MPIRRNSKQHMEKINDSTGAFANALYVSTVKQASGAIETAIFLELQADDGTPIMAVYSFPSEDLVRDLIESLTSAIHRTELLKRHDMEEN